MGCGQEQRPESAELCTSCGLCCSGAIFDWVPISPAEVRNVTELGLDPYEEPPDPPRFNLPCPQLRGTLCGVYERRPSTCAAFRCELLMKLDSGNLALAQAKERVVEAKNLIAKIGPMIDQAGGPITPKRWGRLLGQWKIDARAGRATASEAKVVLDLAILNRFLDTHFRTGDQQVVKPKA